jgi:hypothetical protein
MVAVGNDVQPPSAIFSKPLMTPPVHLSRFKLSSPAVQIALCVTVVAVLTVLRAIFAVTIDLRVDEAYYWTWSKENVISFLDHPPLIAWFVRAGTALFGDSNFGVRAPRCWRCSSCRRCSPTSSGARYATGVTSLPRC